MPVVSVPWYHQSKIRPNTEKYHTQKLCQIDIDV